MKDKSVTFYFLELKAKEKFSSKSLEGGWLFCEKFTSLLSKLLFTNSASCWSCSRGVVET